MADNLYDIGPATLGEQLGRFTAGEVGSILDGALDEFVRFKALDGLRDDGIADVSTADLDNGIEVMGKAAELANLFAGECHVTTRFLG